MNLSQDLDHQEAIRWLEKQERGVIKSMKPIERRPQNTWSTCDIGSMIYYTKTLEIIRYIKAKMC